MITIVIVVCCLILRGPHISPRLTHSLPTRRSSALAYFGLRLGYEGSWDGLNAGATAACGGGRWSGMAVVNHRQGQAPENRGKVGGEGGARTRPNPQDRDGRSLLAKLVFEPSADQRFRLTVEGNEDSADTDVLTSHGLQSLTRATNFLVTGGDHQTRARVALRHEMDAAGAGFADSLDWQVYRPDSETTQDSVEVRRTAGGAHERREREFHFDQRPSARTSREKGKKGAERV